ncbi:MAG: hypothetical protein ACJ74Z_03405 [Bryobacteraceae bacterium]
MAQVGDEFLNAFGSLAVYFSALEEALFWHTAKLIDPADHSILTKDFAFLKTFFGIFMMAGRQTQPVF